MLPRKGFFPREGVGFALEAAEQQRWREKLQVPRFYGGEENRGSVENGGICGVGVAGGDEGTCEREFQRLGEMAGIAANVEVEVDNRGKRVEVAAGVDEQRKEGNGRGRFHGEKNGDCAGELAGMEKHAEELNGREKKSARWIEPAMPRWRRRFGRGRVRTISARVLEGDGGKRFYGDSGIRRRCR